ncbi:DNA helicase UvrD, partial [Candidatus Gottesmanbacteria bacterium]|nr:DNA helicase UvrD [Candidatus Gottesmanbacteria bacterium]
MVIPKIWEWAKRKGIGLVATGDWTHPLWMREIKQNLEETGNGLLKVKSQKSKVKSDEEGPYFLLATEISSIYSQGGKLRRIHNLVWAPSFA